MSVQEIVSTYEGVLWEMKSKLQMKPRSWGLGSLQMLGKFLIWAYGIMGLQPYSGTENLEASELFTGTPQVIDDATFQDRVSVRNQACCSTSVV